MPGVHLWEDLGRRCVRAKALRQDSAWLVGEERISRSQGWEQGSTLRDNNHEALEP